MKNNRETYEQHMVRLFKWIKDHGEFWEWICTPNGETAHMDMRKMKMTIEMLSEFALYEIILVLLTVHRKERYAQACKEDAVFDLLAMHFTDDKTEIVKSLVEYFD